MLKYWLASCSVIFAGCWFAVGTLTAQPYALQDSARYYLSERYYTKALDFARQWEATIRETKGEKSAIFGEALCLLGICEVHVDDYAKARQHLDKSFEIIKKTKGKQGVEIAGVLTGLGQYQYEIGSYKKADSLFRQALLIYEKWPGSYQREIGLNYLHRSNTAEQSGSLDTAIVRSQKATAMLKTVGLQACDYWVAEITLGFQYQQKARYAEATEIYHRILKLQLADTARSFSTIGNTYNNLGGMHFETGNYNLAEKYLSQSMEIFRRKDGEKSQNVAMLLCNIGLLNSYMGNYAKAEKCLLQSIDIYLAIHGELYSTLSTVYNNLGLIYLDLGNLAKAEATFIRAKDIALKTVGETHDATATAMSNLAQTLESQDRHREADVYYLESIRIFGKVYGEMHPKTAAGYLGYSNRCQTSGKLALAEQYLQKAYEINLKTQGEMAYETPLCLVSLGSVNIDMGRYEVASEYLQRAQKGFADIVAKDNLIFHHIFKLMGTCDLLMGKQASAEQKFRNDNRNLFNQIDRYFPTLSETEKSHFFESISEDFELFNSFGLDRYKQNPAIAGDMFDLSLTTKSLLLNSSAKWKQRIKSSGDKKLFMRYTQWEDIQTQLGELYKSTDPGARTLTDSLESEAEKLEKDLSARSENFARISDRKRFTWHDVQKKLKAGEAVVEMVRINRYGLDAGITDSSDERYPVYHQFGASDSVVYAALLVWPGAAIPKLVILENGNQMEGKWGHYYQNCILNQLPDPHSFGRYWKKIADQLGPGIKRIYFSPDGIYHAINLNTLFNPKSKKFVVEERDIRLVTSTKDLLKTGVEENYNKLAYVLGYPDYWKGKARAVDKPTGNRGADLSPLPGTRMEANLISSLLQSKNWEVIELLEDKAVEEALKESYKPKVMHIATHGFFYSDSGQKTNPLLRSGLLLAGAANTLVGSNTETGEDGILTAYEAMNLNLDNTDLVVLSACETGLGEIKNGQGVFGLQRAFQVAGAKSLIMSLWKINDQTTQELMVSFYKHWLGQANSGLHAHSGKSKLQKEMRKPSPVSKRAAFLAAQKELKIKYPDPYYWGAFIMVGE